MSRDELTRISLRIKIILYIILRFALQSQWKLDFFAPISLIEAKFQIVNIAVQSDADLLYFCLFDYR
jgi:hypothetical protein